MKTYCVLSEWEQWSSWGECSELCGAGLRERVRTCASPFGCIGSSKDFKICHIETCKGDIATNENLCNMSVIYKEIYERRKKTASSI
jgi:hypothetical protein